VGESSAREGKVYEPRRGLSVAGFFPGSISGKSLGENYGINICYYKNHVQ
jgi:hypothetical protein